MKTKLTDKEQLECKIIQTKHRLERLENELRLANYMEAAEKIDKIFNEIYRIADESKKERTRKISEVCAMCDMDAGIAVDREGEEIPFTFGNSEFSGIKIPCKTGYSILIEDLGYDRGRIGIGGEHYIKGKYIRNK